MRVQGPVSFFPSGWAAQSSAPYGRQESGSCGRRAHQRRSCTAPSVATVGVASSPGQASDPGSVQRLACAVAAAAAAAAALAEPGAEAADASASAHVALSETGALPRDCSNAFAVSVGADRRGRGLSWWTMPSKGSQVARARNIDGEMVVSHEGPYKRPPRRTVAASKDHHVRMASPPLPPPEATQAMETHPIRAPREGL